MAAGHEWGRLTRDGDGIKSVRNYVFTAWSDPQTYLMGIKKLSYICWGEEICPDTGRLHYQGYLELSKDRTIKAMRKDFKDIENNGVFFEARYGTQEQAINYTKKTALNEGKWKEFGEKKAQGKRNDVLDLIKYLKECPREVDVFEKHPMLYLCHNGAVRRAMSLYQPKRRWMPEVHVWWGEPGLNKSRELWDYADSLLCAVDECSMTASGHLIGYSNAPVVVFDDFDTKNWNLKMFKNVFDRYPLTVNVKGHEAQFNPKVILVSSNYDPHSWFAKYKPVEGLTKSKEPEFEPNQAVVRRLYEEATSHVYHVVAEPDE